MKTVAQMPVGAKARVAKVVGVDQLSLRLMEMGVTPGVEIELIGAAPLGDPLELLIRGYRLSVRIAEAERIELKPST